MAAKLLQLSSYFIDTLQFGLETRGIPTSIIALASNLHDRASQPMASSPIIPVLTPYPRPLSAYLFARGMNVRPITWPTVPKGKDRVRVCLHAGNTKKEVDSLINGILSWAVEKGEENLGINQQDAWGVKRESNQEIFFESKL